MQRFDGFIDVHAHADPDRTSRSLDVLELCRMYRDRGFRGVVIMNHYDSSAGYAYLARKAVPDLEVFGGIVLNHLMGGMNLHAIEHMTQIEGGYGRIVYMPTVNSQYDVLNSENPDRPCVPISARGRLLPEVLAAIDRVAELGLVLSTGHSSPEEILLLARAAKERGVTQVLATNPVPQNMSVPQMIEAADLGVYIEFIYYSASPSRRGGPPHTMSEYAAAIRAIGPERCILSSCGGQGWMPVHTAAWEEYLDVMREHGFTQADVDVMCKHNPARLLGLDVWDN